MGPNYSISTACATANYCFVAAQHHLRSGQADIMLVGGSEAPIIPVGLGGFVACRWGLQLSHLTALVTWPCAAASLSGASCPSSTCIPTSVDSAAVGYLAFP